MSDVSGKVKMAITEFVGYLRCQVCDQKGFQGRERVEETPIITDWNEMAAGIIWHWKCKYCGSKNKFIHTA